MKLFFSSTLSKILAAIMAMFMPLTTLTTAIHADKPKPAPFKDNTEVIQYVPQAEDEEDYGFVDENEPAEEEKEEVTEPEEATEPEATVQTLNEDETAPVEEDVEGDATAQLQGAAAAQGKEEVEGNEPVMTWNVPGTEDSNVTMSYYDKDNTSFIDNVTGAIKALFLPMTALAAEEITYEDGTVVISGTGATAPMLFTRWLNADKFIPFYNNWCHGTTYGAEGGYALYSDINEYGEVTGEIVHYIAVCDNYESNEAFLEDYCPVFIGKIASETPDFWETYAIFNPKSVIIEGDVSVIGFGAFMACTNITDLKIYAPVEEIKSFAFSNTGLRGFGVPSSVRIIGEEVCSGCKNLETVMLPSTLEYIGNWAFYDMATNSTIHCQSQSVADLLVYALEVEPRGNVYDTDGNLLRMPTNNYNARGTTLVVYNEGPEGM